MFLKLLVLVAVAFPFTLQADPICWSGKSGKLNHEWRSVLVQANELEKQLDYMEDLADEEEDRLETLAAKQNEELAERAEDASDKFHKELYCNGTRKMYKVTRYYSSLTTHLANMNARFSTLEFESVLSTELGGVAEIVNRLDVAYKLAIEGK